MLETVPKLEQELEKFVIKFIKDTARAYSPIIGEIAEHPIFEGDRSVIVRPNGEEEETEFKEISASHKLPSEMILYSSIDEILNAFVPVAQEMASSQSKMLFDTIHEVTQKTGNVVDATGAKLSHDKLLEVLEKIQIDFDANGNPKMPTMAIHPSMEQRINELNNDPAAKEYERRQKELIEKKRIEWREREANRTLVG